MKFFAIVNQDMEELAQQELKELIKVEAKVVDSVLEFETEKISFVAQHMQSARRLLVAVDRVKDINKLNLAKISTDFASYKIEVEHVKGQENRTSIQKGVAEKLGSLMKKIGKELKIELKEPACILLVYFNGSEYFVGVDVAGEIDARDFRVFPHSGSFKGDLAYFFVRKSGFKKDEKLLMGFVKDGSVAIEAALFADGKPVRSLSKDRVSKSENSKSVFAFDEGRQNIVAARKNASIAGAVLEINKYELDDLDVKYEKEEFDRLIFHITSKDESKLNEIYYQATYLLKREGTLLLIGREKWDPSISDRFSLIEQGTIQRGESLHAYWLLKRV
jgi:23S rRNA G2445 N2-methylase RlmL